jgi:peptide/nickel transport system permease protein
MRRIQKAFASLRKYPSAIASLFIISSLIALSVYTAISLPYARALDLWRGGPDMWSDTPRNAMPAWTNVFRSEKLPETLVLRTSDLSDPQEEAISATIQKVISVLEFNYPYGEFPQEINVFFDASFEERQPQVTLTWITPDGRELPLMKRSVTVSDRYSASQDSKLERKYLNSLDASVGLLADLEAGIEELKVLTGDYKLRVETVLFEEGSSVDARLVVYGKVYGIAGTDHRRRDISIGLFWGTPIALLFGLLAAVGSTILTFVIAAVGVWYGGWIDAAIQRITEVNLQLPVLPILIMVGTFYSRSIWLILGVIILLNIFSAGIKGYRAMFLQVKNSPYIEAARAYGASNMRIILRYLIPKILPVLVPSFVILIPGYVFLEASLALLGLGDPILPTWGKVLNDAYQNGALYRGYYYWVLQPAVLLMYTGLGFSMLGFSLDRIFNPRLRGV